jgi:outer membrane protein TolC
MPAGAGGRIGIHALLIVMLVAAVLVASGCGTTAALYRKSADRTANKIVEKRQEQLFGTSQDFNIDRPADVLRQRLLMEQDLLQSGKASLGAYNLEKVPFWPEWGYPVSKKSGASEDGIVIEDGASVKLTLMQALQVGALNSSEYQKMKESVFQAALTVNLQRDQYGFTLDAGGESSISADNTSGETVKTESSRGTVSLSKNFKNGAKFASSLVTAVGVDIVELLSGDSVDIGKSISGEASLSIPLLRGAGKHIAAENLTQAEQSLVYAIFQFERYKKTFAVNVVSNYLSVLQQSDQIDNAAENYRNLITSTRRTQRLADAGRSTVIEVNQTLQQELSARANWIKAMQTYENGLDSFKTLLGLPADADIELDRTELDRLNETYVTMAEAVNDALESETSASEELAPASMAGATELEMAESEAIQLAFDNRLDLRVSEGKVYDAQRNVVVKADNLRAEVTLLGSASSSNNEDTDLDLDHGILTGLLTIDLPIERTSERNEYRNSYIALEQAVRDLQSLEDDIKLSVRQNLNQMKAARESMAIQTRAVAVAQNQAKSTDMFFEAGRSELRDLLEAQEALLTARNSLTSAVVQYRSAELEFQRDTGILKIDDKGLLVEYTSTGE